MLIWEMFIIGFADWFTLIPMVIYSSLAYGNVMFYELLDYYIALSNLNNPFIFNVTVYYVV